MIANLKEQFELERVSLEGLQQCIDLIKTGYLEREMEYKMLSLLPCFPVRNASIHLAFEVDGDDLKKLEALKEIVTNLKASMELKLSMILPYM